MRNSAPSELVAAELSLGYDRGPAVVRGVDVEIAPGQVTSVIGANGCGKSTLLRGLARLLAPRSGQVVLDGRSIHTQKTKDVAKRIGLLPQGPVAPDGLIAEDLVARGRYPHQSLLRQWSHADEEAVIADVFGVSCVVIDDPVSGTQLCVPRAELGEPTPPPDPSPTVLL